MAKFLKNDSQHEKLLRVKNFWGRHLEVNLAPFQTKDLWFKAPLPSTSFYETFKVLVDSPSTVSNP